MYIYNITFNINHEIEKDWLKFVKKIFIPKILKTDFIQSVLTTKIINNQTKENSYSIQLKIKNNNSIDEFINKKLHPILKEINIKFYPKMLYFSTTLLIIDNTDEK